VTQPRRRRSRRKRITRIGWNVVGLVVTVVMLFPVYWMIATAFKPEDEANALIPTWLPQSPTLDNFRHAMARPFFWENVKNSLIVSSSRSSFARARVPRGDRPGQVPVHGRRLFIILVIGIQMLPQAGLIIPLYIVLAKYGAVNSLKGLIVTYMTFVLPFAVWTLRGFLIGIPKELEEAAMVDGSSRLGAFVRILLPLVAPGLVATSVFAFITAWNEFIFAYVLLNDQSKQTATVWLSYYVGTSRHVDWGGLMAGSTLIAIPVVIFFILVQRKIAFGLTAGAVKA
jgi:N,N'-diacetylchitobiose transport system permease protein